MSTHPGRIQINTGTFTSECVLENDLIANQAKRPVIREQMEYANRRSLTTLLVSGVVTPYGINNTEKTKIPDVATKGKGIGNNGYQFSVMGRIEKASVILRQVGATQADGRFQLVMNDDHLYPGMNAVFNGNGFIAKLESISGGPGNYLASFWNFSGDTFSWSTHVASQQGTKTCMGSYTGYGEKSEKGYSRSKFADMFINHTTKQRKTAEISGDAASDILWYTFQADDGTTAKGWMYAQLKQAQATFLYEDERQKFMGVSSMKNSDGTFRQQPPVGADGKALIEGDGLWEQIGSGNVFEGSGTNGEFTISDMRDVGITLKQQGNLVTGQYFVWITGSHGFANWQDQAVSAGVNQNITFMDNVVKGDSKYGGPLKDVGYEFAKINLDGVSHMVVQHPFFDDELMWTARGDDGNILKSSEYTILGMGQGDSVNMEILHKSANGVNRQNVTAAMNGLTGASEMTISEEDAMKYAMLKEDLIVLYNTQICARGVKTH